MAAATYASDLTSVLSLGHYEHLGNSLSLFIAGITRCGDEQQELIILTTTATSTYISERLCIIVYVLTMAPRRCEPRVLQKPWRILFRRCRSDVHWWSTAMLTPVMLLALVTVVPGDGLQQPRYDISLFAYL